MPQQSTQYRRLVDLVPENAEARYNLGLALKNKDQLEDAVAELKKAVELKPDLAEANYTLGVILLQQAKLDEAGQAFRSAIASRADYAEAHYALGTVLQQQGKLDDAIAAFREALKHAPNAPEIHNTLGNALRQKGDRQAAQLEFAEAARLNKKKSNSQAAMFALNTGAARLKEGNLDAAIERFQAAIGLDPENPEGYRQLAEALEKKGDRRAAEQARERRRATARGSADPEVTATAHCLRCALRTSLHCRTAAAHSALRTAHCRCALRRCPLPAAR